MEQASPPRRQTKHNFRPLQQSRLSAVSPNYSLSVVQQPQQARATGRSKRFTGRRTIDPPPVIQVSLCVDNVQDVQSGQELQSVQKEQSVQSAQGAHEGAHEGAQQQPHQQRKQHASQADDSDVEMADSDTESAPQNVIQHTVNPLVLVALIIDENAPARALGEVIEETEAGGQQEDHNDFENLVGTTCVVANMVSDKTFDNTMRAVFVFSNLSVKQDGNYKLRFTLYEFSSFASLYSYNQFTAPNLPVVVARAQIDLEVFKVYTAKKFPGLTTLLKLLFDLKSLGTKIKVRHLIRLGKKSDKPVDRLLNSIFRRNPPKEVAKLESPESAMEDDLLTPHYPGSVNSADDSGLLNSFATNTSDHFAGVTPVVLAISALSTSSLQSAAHSFGSFFLLGRTGPPAHLFASNAPQSTAPNPNLAAVSPAVAGDVLPLRMLLDVAQQLPMMQVNNELIPLPPGLPKPEVVVNNGTMGFYNNTHYRRLRANTLNSLGGLEGYKTHRLSFSNGTINTYHQHSGSHSSRYGHQSQDLLLLRHLTILLQTPTSTYFQTPNNNHLSVQAKLVTKRSDQHLGDEVEDGSDVKKSKTGAGSQYKNAIMKIQNIIN